MDEEKGVGTHLPERPEGCFAQMGTVPFFPPKEHRWPLTDRRGEFTAMPGGDRADAFGDLPPRAGGSWASVFSGVILGWARSGCDSGLFRRPAGATVPGVTSDGRISRVSLSSLAGILFQKQDMQRPGNSILC